MMIFVYIYNILDTYNPKPIISGHTNCVTDISYDPEEKYFISSSKDMSCRLYSKIKDNWFELARPQVFFM